MNLYEIVPGFCRGQSRCAETCFNPDRLFSIQ